MFGKILIANRGEIAVRIARTAQAMGIATATIYSDADQRALHVRVADEAFRIGPAPASESYLNADAIIAVARRCGAEAIHPGYGFLAENPDFAESVTGAGLVFIGPPAEAIRAVGLKDRARKLMARTGVPVLPGYDGDNQDTDHLRGEADRIGYPILIKPVAGGGGKGMHRVDDPETFADELARARREAASAFGDDRVVLEKFIAQARHIEIQIFADKHGNVIHLFERDCSLQRRHQKVIEEAPAPGMSAAIRAAMGKAAVDAAMAVGYVGAGTVEYIADLSDGLQAGRFYFLEMNTRLQVEHPVTELITGLDLVEWQFRIANGEPLPLRQVDLVMTGHAIEARLYAEDPAQNFQPQTGRFAQLEFPPDLRVDTGFSQGDSIGPYYDPMIAKLIAHGSDRASARQKLSAGLAATRIGGCRTNLAFLDRLVRDAAFAAGDVDTGFIARHINRLVTSGEPPLLAIAAAVLHRRGHLSKPAGSAPFETLTNFRLWYGEASSCLFEVDGTPLAASLTDLGNAEFEIRHAKHSVRFSLLDHDGLAMRVVQDGSITRLTYVDHGAGLMIGLGAALYEFVMPHAMTPTDEEPSSGQVTAAMPGRISMVSVKPGDRVTRGDIIAVTEAMKMEFTLRAAKSGKVAMVHVTAGDQVVEGAVIATIEQDDA